MKEKPRYYTIKNIMKQHAQYNMVIGERSNGKTFAPLKYVVERYFETGEQFALLRRWDTDFKGKNGSQLVFKSLECDAFGKNNIKEISGGKYNGVSFRAGAYYLTELKAGQTVVTDIIIGYGLALNMEEHYKEGAYPLIKTIIFDEFIARNMYLPDEFIIFMNLISTIKRRRQDVLIFMLGNTISKYCPYFSEMGLYKVKKMQKGDLDVYNMGDSGLKVAVEFSDSPSRSGNVDPYFAFNNPKLKMITTGAWEIDIYPHLPTHYKPKDVVFEFFVDWSDELAHCEIIELDDSVFIYAHRKTTPIKNKDDLVFSEEPDIRPNVIHNIFRTNLPVVLKIIKLFREHKVFYQDNELGEMLRHFLQDSRQRAGTEI